MVLIVKTKERLLSLFHLCKEAAPRDYIVLVLVIEDHLGVDEVFNNLLTATILQKLGPSCADSGTLLIVMNQWIIMQIEGWSHIDVEAGHAGKNDKHDSRVKSISHDWALSEAEVPNLFAEVIR